MPAQVAMLLLRSSGLPRLSYLCRTVSPDLLLKAAQHFDAMVIDTFLIVCGLAGNLTPATWNQIRLPISKGGMGLHSFVSLSPAAFVASAAQARPELSRILLTRYSRESGVASAAQECFMAPVNHALRLLQHNLPHTERPILPHPDRADTWTDLPNQQFLQRRLTKQLQVGTAHRLHAASDVSDCARVLSASQHAASAWLALVPSEPELHLATSTFQFAVRHRLGLPPANLADMPSVDCFCGEADFKDDPSHLHACPLLRRTAVNARHNGIVQALASLARNELGLHVSIEPSWYDAKGGQDRPDAVITTHARSWLVDVSVVHSSAASYLSRFHTHLRPRAAAAQREKEKHGKYDGMADANGPGMTMVPFVLESFGAVGEEASAFIHTLAHLSGDAAAFTRHAFDCLSVALQRGNARISKEGLVRIRAGAARRNPLLHSHVAPAFGAEDQTDCFSAVDF